MINGIYSGATALENFSRQQELVASNLAHINTPGYRRKLFTFQQKTDGAEKNPIDQPGASVGTLSTDFEEGTRKPTGRALDVAISGDAFFTYQGSEAEVYSRNGALFRDPTGQLVNGDGLPILGEGRPIVIPPEVSDYDLIIDASGSLSANGTELGQLSLVKFNDNQLLGMDNQIYFTIGEAIKTPAEDAQVHQGTRELSNSHPVNELISLIVGSRSFESAQRAIRTISDSIQENIRAV